MHNHVIFLFQQFIIFIIEKYSNWKRANLRRIFVPFRETSHIVIVAVWARTNFREIRCFTFYAQLPQCHRRLQPCLRHQNLGASINDTAATYNKKRQGCETWPWLYCWKWEGGDWEESLGKPKLSASTAPPNVGFLKHLDILKPPPVGFRKHCHWLQKLLFWHLHCTWIAASFPMLKIIIMIPIFPYLHRNQRLALHLNLLARVLSIQ